jgi:ribosomal protein L13
MKTLFQKRNVMFLKWFVIDAEGQTLGCLTVKE